MPAFLEIERLVYSWAKLTKPFARGYSHGFVLSKKLFSRTDTTNVKTGPVLRSGLGRERSTTWNRGSRLGSELQA